MKAVRANADHAAVLEECSTPAPGPGMTLIKTLSAGICGSDLHTIRRLQSGYAAAETMLGHEVCGVVAELGEGVESAQVGDRVTVEPLHRCGRCLNCLAGRYNVCYEREFVLGNYVDRPGGLAEYFEVPAYCLVPVSETLSDDEGALIEPLAVGVHALKVARPGFRPTVGVIGAGSIGLAVVMAAAAIGAPHIIVGARPPTSARRRRAPWRPPCSSIPAATPRKRRCIDNSTALHSPISSSKPWAGPKRRSTSR